WFGPALNTRASTSTARAGAFPELNRSSSNSNLTSLSSTMQRSGCIAISSQGLSAVETTTPGPGDGARGGGGAGAGSGAFGRGAEVGSGVGSGAANRSMWGPPANAARERWRQKRNKPPAARATAASSHGHSDRPCSGASVPVALAGSGAKPAAAGTGAAEPLL